MGMTADIRTYLLADATIAALVGTQVYPAGEVSQNVAGEFLVIQKLGDDPLHTHAGRIAEAMERWQVTAWVRRDGDGNYVGRREALEDAVRARMDLGSSVTMGSTAGVTIHKDSEIPTFDRAEDGSDDVDHGTLFEFTLWHARAA